MKTLLLIAFSLTTALAQTANAAKPPDQDAVKPAKKQQRAPAPRQAPVPQAPKRQHNPNVRPQTPVYRAPHVNPVKQAPQVRSLPDQDAVRRPNRNPDLMPRVRPNPSVVVPPTVTVQPNINPRKHSDWDNRDRTDRDRTDRDRTDRDRTDRDRTDRDRTDRDRTDRNWQNRHSNNNNNNNSWEQARRRHHHNHHHRDWWRSRYSRFALFGAGYYFWDNGYWFPAYGYDPAYNTYAYSEPIYGYNDLEPAQVITSVQTELQRQGYYRYAVDGEMGPATRAAIANYQRDNGLSITSAIDEPTLQSLGLD